MSDLENLFARQLREIYDGEHVLANGLSELEKHAKSKLLKLALRYHLKQTELHAQRLEKVFREVGDMPDRRGCAGIEGILDEAQALVEEFTGTSALDAGLIAAAQKGEHYEIATYGSLCSWAEELAKTDALKLLKENLSDAKAADRKLTHLAEAARSPQATQDNSARRPQETVEIPKLVTQAG